MTVYMSASWDKIAKHTYYRLHSDNEPTWDAIHGLWASNGSIGLCNTEVERTLGNKAPLPGELVELEVQVKDVWVWK